MKPVNLTVPATDKREILEVLKFELEFLEKGGYHRSVRTPWRPQFIFEDSPSCPNFNAQGERVPCSECVLMDLVPSERRLEKVPCRFVPLNETGETIDYFYKCGTQQELELALQGWLRKTIQRLEAERGLAG